MGLPEPSPLDVQALYERYGRAVYRRCQYFLKSDADATDAMHDVFVKVVQCAGEFRGEASPLTWLVRIATNHCLNLLRSRRAAWRDRFEEDARLEQGASVGALGRIERRQLVLAVLAHADRRAQEAAVYYFVDEMTQEDAARAAGCSVPTLRKRLRAFIKAARRRLKTMDPELVFGAPPV